MDRFGFIYFLVLISALLCCQESPKYTSNVDRNSITVISADTLIIGKWVVESLSIPSVSLPTFCNHISKGAIFVFSENDSLNVYPRSGVEACDVYTYKANDGVIQVVKADMAMLIEYKHSQNNLLLRSKSFFRWKAEDVQDSLAYRSLLEDGVTVSLIKVEP